MSHPLSTVPDIGSKVQDFLSESGFNVNYDSSRGTYRPWYRREVEVKYVEKGRRFSYLSVGYLSIATFSFKNKEIKIPTDGRYKTIDEVTRALLHQTGHADIWPVGFPLKTAGIYGVFEVVSNHFDDPTKGILAGVAAFAVYHFVIGELVVEGYNTIKHGKKYIKLLTKSLKKLSSRP